MIFDGHGDVWTDVTCRRQEHGERDVFRRRHLDKFRVGDVTGGIFVIWIDPPYDTDPHKRAMQIVEAVKAEKAEAADIIYDVRNFEDFKEAAAQNKIAVVTGMEGASEIGEDIDMFDWFFDEMDVRHAMLTWNETNALATGWPGDPNRGLTPKGFEALKRMNDLGMVVDVSHLNDKCFWDIIDKTSGVVIASHSNARAVCPAMRNLSDDMLKAIADADGLAGLNSMREFVGEYSEQQTVEHLADHAAYIADLIGSEHIGLGFDFDDYLETDALEAFSSHTDSPSCLGISNEREASNILGALRDHGFTDKEIEGIAYGNFYRVFKRVWK